jgi:hypothetical protein
MRPWTLYPAQDYRTWNPEAQPYLVRWTMLHDPRLRSWRTECREFSTEAEAREAYGHPAAASVELIRCEHALPGKPFTILAERKEPKPKRRAA